MSKKKDGFRKKRILSTVSPRGRYFDKEPATSDKVARNDPCPCGSGKKYKHCCRVRPRSMWQRIVRWFSGKESY